MFLYVYEISTINESTIMVTITGKCRLKPDLMKHYFKRPKLFALDYGACNNYYMQMFLV